MVNEYGSVVDAVYYNKLRSDCGSIVHSGDEGDGQGDSHSEIIILDLPAINYKTQYLAILVNSYNGEGFKSVETARVQIC